MDEAGPEFLNRNTWDLGITFQDGTQYILSLFPFEDIMEGELRFEEELAFWEYESLLSGEKISTKEQEKAIQIKKEQEEEGCLW